MRIGEDLFEVVTADKSGEEWVYRLEPWTGRDIIRVYVEWNEESERKFMTGLRDDKIQERKNLMAWGAQAFLGFLPAKIQRRFRQTTGLNPARATFWSAALETAAASPFVFFFVINMVSGTAGFGISVPAWAGVAALAAIADGLFRLAAVISTGSPIGSMFLLPLNFRMRSEAPLYVPSDQILEADGVLNVVAPVPKVWWERAGGVMYGGEAYILERVDLEKGKFIYRFRKGGEKFPVLNPELERIRNRSSDLSYVFAPLWGFLPKDLQKTLEFYGRYRPQPNVVISICINFLLALVLVGPGLRSMSLGILKIGSLAMMCAGLYLFVESVMRLLRLIMDGQATGSFLAFLVKPVYHLVIKDTPIPPS